MRFLIAALFTTVLFAGPASAQIVCGDRGKIVAQLTKGFGESRHGMGLHANGAVVELFTSPKGSWTVLITPPPGPTCILGNGESWETFKQENPKGTKL